MATAIAWKDKSGVVNGIRSNNSVLANFLDIEDSISYYIDPKDYIYRHIDVKHNSYNIMSICTGSKLDAKNVEQLLLQGISKLHSVHDNVKTLDISTLKFIQNIFIPLLHECYYPSNYRRVFIGFQIILTSVNEMYVLDLRDEGIFITQGFDNFCIAGDNDYIGYLGYQAKVDADSNNEIPDSIVIKSLCEYIRSTNEESGYSWGGYVGGDYIKEFHVSKKYIV